eukprot:GEMP01103334.1.p2 GENE.GEMP01103334.1~~GEMP01103334.1.p2  ORF type:complete len:104 (-),score=9.48 GEMP01103334.1:461-742(-)
MQNKNVVYTRTKNNYYKKNYMFLIDFFKSKKKNIKKNDKRKSPQIFANSKSSNESRAISHVQGGTTHRDNRKHKQIETKKPNKTSALSTSTST